MKWFIRAVLALIALLVVAALVIPMFIDGEWVEARVEEEATKALGRQVTIEGPTSISVIPARVSLGGLTIANAEGFEAPHFVKTGEASVGVELLPLLSQNIEITNFTLNSPDIRLEMMADGSANWELGTETTERAAEDGPDTTDGGSFGGDINLGTVRITDGLVTFDNQTDVTYRAEDVDLALTLTSLDDPLELQGTMELQGEPSRLDATLTTPRRFMEGERADLALSMLVGENEADTSMSISDDLSFDGQLNVDVPALRSLIALAGVQIDTPNGFEEMRIAGPVSGSSTNLQFGESTSFGVDKIAGTGPLGIDLSGERPKLTGDIRVQTLNVSPYIPVEAENSAGGSASSDGGEFPAWSDEPVDLSALATTDMDLTITAAEVISPFATAINADLALTAVAGDVRANLRSLQVFEGTGSGLLRANVRGRTPQIEADMVFEDIAMEQFAQQVMGVSNISGTGGVILDLTTRGQSEADWVSDLTGTGRLELAEGAIKGINLGQIIQGSYDAWITLREEGGLSVATLAPTITSLITSARGPAQTTDFTALDLGLLINDGDVVAEGFSMTAPFFRLTGDASVNLPAQTMRMSFIPALTNIDGGGTQTLPAPIAIGGTFNAPTVGLDTQPFVSGLARDQIGNALGVDLGESDTIRGALEGAAARELGNLLGGGRRDDDGEGDDEALPSDADSVADELVREGLGRLFGGSDDDDADDEPAAEDPPQE